MSSIVELASGLGAASALLQAHLGLGIVLGALGVGVATTPELRKTLAEVPWETTLRNAAQEMRAIPLLVLFALMQTRSSAPDTLTSLGLLAAGGAGLLAAFCAVLAPVASGAAAASVTSGSPGARALCAIGAFGHALLVFGVVPDSGIQLLCASAFARAASAVQAASLVARATGKGSGPLAEAAKDLGLVAGLAPAIGGLALLDMQVWGAGSAILVVMQPAISASALLVVIFLAHLGGARVVGTSELGFHLKAPGSSEKALEPLRSGAASHLALALALGAARAFGGVFRFEFSAGGIAIEWSEPLTAAAAKLVVCIALAYVAERLLGSHEPEEPQVLEGVEPINGLDMSSGETKGIDAKHYKELPTIHYVKALIAPAHVLLLALIAARLSLPTTSDDDDEAEFFIATLIKLPFRYGFTLATGGVFLQVIALLFYAMGRGDSAHATSEPPFDGTGTLLWTPPDASAQRVAASIRSITIVLLQGGLVLGCLGLGPMKLIAGGAGAFAVLYFSASAQARETANTVVTVGLSAMFSSIGDFLEQRRQAQEAAAAKKAAAVAKSLVAESAPSPNKQTGGGAKGGGKGSPMKPGAASGDKKDKRRPR